MPALGLAPGRHVVAPPRVDAVEHVIEGIERRGLRRVEVILARAIGQNLRRYDGLLPEVVKDFAPSLVRGA